jgi:hypothetical protein
MAMAQPQQSIIDFVDNYMETNDIDAPEFLMNYVYVIKNVKRLNINYETVKNDIETLDRMHNAIKLKFIQMKQNGEVKTATKRDKKLFYKFINDKTYTLNNMKKVDKYVLNNVLNHFDINVLNKIINTYFYDCYVLNGEEIKSGKYDIETNDIPLLYEDFFYRIYNNKMLDMVKAYFN